METHTSPAGGLDPLLSLDELAEYLGIPVRTIYDWRTDGKGPRGVRIGKHVKFFHSDVRAWLDQQREPAPGRAGQPAWPPEQSEPAATEAGGR
ncbi:helix-turn-helix transcriptional regulator [Promicromonospora sp. MS192]|uniref:helix-turn-helix transcriptional regulator n=1 Tax=Promicromonospora sp. MS192 TaxID=3412684 RepID=UPI003C2F542B